MPDLNKRIVSYDHKSSKRQKKIKAAFDMSCESATAMTVPLNALSTEEPWRSAAEQQLMQGIPGWPKGIRQTQYFLEPSEVFESSNDKVRRSLDICNDAYLPWTRKLQRCSEILCCAPSPSMIERELAFEAQRQFSDLPVQAAAFPCRLCAASYDTGLDLQAHITTHHCGGKFTDARAFAEYRKHVFHISKSIGPASTPWEAQRRFGANFVDKVLRAGNADENPRCEHACVVCARLMWRDKLCSVKLFATNDSKDAAQHDSADEGEDPTDPIQEIPDERAQNNLTKDQQHRVFELLAVSRYGKRWPHIWDSEIGRRELLASSVQCPVTQAQLLLHQRRVPGAVDVLTGNFVADAAASVLCCGDCKKMLFRKVPQMPKYALANDNWGGRTLPQLMNLSPGTVKLLPRVRVCVNVTVLGPKHMPKDLKQMGLVGNHIMVPQASPTQVLRTLPPADADADALADSISFVAVATNASNFHKAKLWSAPRQQYTNAVRTLKEVSLGYESVIIDEAELQQLPEDDSPAMQLLSVTQNITEDDPLCKTLNQLGPADSNEATVGAAASDDDTMADSSSSTTVRDADVLPGSSAALIGGSEAGDEMLSWLRLKQQVIDLCEPSLRRGSETVSVAEEYYRLQKANGVTANDLQGKDKAFACNTENKVRSLQSLAAMAGRTKWDARLESILHDKPIEALVMPGGGELVSMFDPMTFALAMPECFSYGDLVPFLKRTTKISFLEWLQMILTRDELCYDCSTDAVPYKCTFRNRWSDSEQFTPVAYDMWRRLQLISCTKAHVQRSGFQSSCKLIAELEADHLLEAIALLGKTADIRSVVRNKTTNPRVKEALQALVLCTGRILGTEGHRTALRHKSVAAGLHYCAASLFVTPNLADTRAALIVTLMKGPDAEEIRAELPLLQEDPDMPSLAQMMRNISNDAVAQAKFFDLSYDQCYVHRGPWHKVALAERIHTFIQHSFL